MGRNINLAPISVSISYWRCGFLLTSLRESKQQSGVLIRAQMDTERAWCMAVQPYINLWLRGAWIKTWILIQHFCFPVLKHMTWFNGLIGPKFHMTVWLTSTTILFPIGNRVADAEYMYEALLYIRKQHSTTIPFNVRCSALVCTFLRMVLAVPVRLFYSKHIQLPYDVPYRDMLPLLSVCAYLI